MRKELGIYNRARTPTPSCQARPTAPALAHVHAPLEPPFACSSAF